MIRTGYLRWEIEASEQRSQQDRYANEVTLRARPSYRNVRIKWTPRSSAEKAFVQGVGTYADVIKGEKNDPVWDEIAVPDVGPRMLRYSISDREKLPRFWMEKIQRFASAFAAEVVSAAASYVQLMISSPALRLTYAKMVEMEILRVINGQSKARPTNNEEQMEVDVTQHQEGGIPELVAAELVRDVFEADHFQEFCYKNYVTIKSQDKTYRIYRHSRPDRRVG